MDIIKEYKRIKNEFFIVHEAGLGIIKNLLIWLLIVNGFLYFLQLNDFYFSIVNILSVLLFLYVGYSFRKPVRLVSSLSKAIVSPTDGIVADISNADSNFQKITIKMTIFGSNVLQAPVNGVFSNFEGVVKVPKPEETVKPFHYTGKCKFDIDCFENQKLTLNIYPGFIARNLYCKAVDNAACTIGENIGLIYFGGKIEVLIPANSKLLVTKGEKVKANLTQLALL